MFSSFNQVVFAVWLLAGAFVGEAASAPEPLLRAHAHNDYEHKRPLLDALEAGFCSVEADIHLMDGKLLVAHDRNQVRSDRTLEFLYLGPLRRQVLQNGGRVYTNGPTFYLLIDIKGTWRTAYPVLLPILRSYADILTTFNGDKKVERALTVIITGDRNREMFAGEATRYACLDGELADLDSQEPAELLPWISSNWTKSFTWNGMGVFPEPEREKLKQIVNKAHTRGRLVRFWGSPDVPAFWRELVKCGVDLINTDDLEGMKRFFQAEH